MTAIYRIIIMVVCCWMVSSCKTTLLPNYTTVDRLSRLNPGMTKSEALQTLNNIYPFDILNGEKDGCEVHQYKYKHPNQKVLDGKIDKRSGLRGGSEKFLKEGDAYLVYKNGLLYSAHTNERKDIGPLLASIAEVNDACNYKIARGCMDPTSINYNPDAQEDDGTCEYCECGYVKNPEYNPNRSNSGCNTPCIKMDEATQKTCGPCDFLDAAKKSSSNVVFNIDWNNHEQQNPNTNNPKSKGKMTTTKGNNVNSYSQEEKSFNKKEKNKQEVSEEKKQKRKKIVKRVFTAIGISAALTGVGIGLAALIPAIIQ